MEKSQQEQDIKKTEANLNLGGLNISSSGENLEEQQHPLLNVLILDKILKYVIGPCIPISDPRESWKLAGVCKDVKRIRLVCRLWKERVTPLYREIRPPMQFWSNKEGLTMGRGTSPSLKKFLGTMQHSTLLPASRYWIEAIEDEGKNAPQLAKDFLQICGPETKELGLVLHQLTNYFDAITKEDLSDINLAKLQKFTLSLDVLEYQSMPSMVEPLFKATQKLEEFIFLSNTYCTPAEGILTPSEFLCKIIPGTMKAFRLSDFYLTDEHFRALSEKGLTLSECNLNFWIFSCSKEIFQEFFRSQSGTLKKLSMAFPQHECDHFDEFPEMRELTELKLTTTFDPHPLKISVPHSFPKLAVLDLKGLAFKEDYESLLESKHTISSVKELFLPHKFPIAERIKKTSSLFPNIKILHVVKSPDIVRVLREVFLHFGNILELSTDFGGYGHGDDSDDEGEGEFSPICADILLSGVSKSDLVKIYTERDFDSVDLKSVQRFPALLNLTKLKIFSMKGNATDLTAHFVILRMPALEEFRSSKLTISPTYVDRLREKLKVFQVRHICGIDECEDSCTDFYGMSDLESSIDSLNSDSENEDE